MCHDWSRHPEWSESVEIVGSRQRMIEMIKYITTRAENVPRLLRLRPGHWSGTGHCREGNGFYEGN